MSVLRRICGISNWRRNWRRNVDIKQDLAINVDIVERLQRRKMTYFSHVTRMSNDRFLNIGLLLHRYGSGQRARGRPRKKWMDNIKEDCNDMGMGYPSQKLPNLLEIGTHGGTLSRTWAASTRRLRLRRGGIESSNLK